jgi:hypothetical protein
MNKNKGVLLFRVPNLPAQLSEKIVLGFWFNPNDQDMTLGIG